MTRAWGGYGDPTPFSMWLRELGDPLTSRTISNQNLDYVWHDYPRNFLLTLEEKRHGARPSAAQNDTHGVVAQLLAMSDGRMVSTLRGLRPARYFGHYVVVFENTTPDDGAMRINGQECSRIVLLKLLAFDEHTIAAFQNTMRRAA